MTHLATIRLIKNNCVISLYGDRTVMDFTTDISKCVTSAEIKPLIEETIPEQLRLKVFNNDFFFDCLKNQNSKLRLELYTDTENFTKMKVWHELDDHKVKVITYYISM